MRKIGFFGGRFRKAALSSIDGRSGMDIPASYISGTLLLFVGAALLELAAVDLCT